MIVSSFKNFEDVLSLIKNCTKDWIITDDAFPIFIAEHQNEMLKRTLGFLLNEKKKCLVELVQINDEYIKNIQNNTKDYFYDEKKKLMDSKILTLNNYIEKIRIHIK